jgi:hypothetical protein
MNMRHARVVLVVTSIGLLVTMFAVSAAAKRSSTQAATAVAVATCTAASGVNLVSGSNFEIDTNANLKTDGASPCTDWNAVGPSVVKADKPTGTSDDSLKNGADINDPQPSIDTGSIPNNKSDLSNFGIYVEHNGAQSILNLFWSRVQNPSGTTDMDFEFNQKRCQADGTDCADNTPSGGKTPLHVTPLRTQGDVMITYLLANGGTNPTILVRIWNGNSTSGSWGAGQTIAGAKASINTTAIAAADSELGALSALTFGEASLDAGVLFGAATQCKSFGSAYLKSRASDTDNTAGKDLIAPEPINITNCGSVVVKKTDNAPSPALLAGATFTINPGSQAADGTVAATSTLLDESTVGHHGSSAHSGYYCIDNVPLDSGSSTHTVTETAAPTGYEKANPDHQSVTVSNAATCDERMNATIVPDLTFVDTPQLGAIKIVKLAKDKNCTSAASASGSTSLKCTSTTGSALLSGATFQVCTNAGPYTAQNPCAVAPGGSVTTNSVDASFGTVCVGSLPSGTGTTYYIHETGSGSTNISADATDQSATLTGNSTCAGSPTTKTFTDQPLTTITVSTTSLAGTGVTQSTVQCTPGETATSNTPHTTGSLTPGTYTCSVVIDP